MERIQIIVISENSGLVENLGVRIREIQPNYQIIKAASVQQTLDFLRMSKAVIMDADSGKGEIVEFINTLNTEFPYILKFLWVDGRRREFLKELVPEIKGLLPQCLWKQQSEAVIAEAVCRAIFFADWLDYKQVNKALAQMRDIPTVPFIYFKLMNLLNDLNASVEDMSETIAEDPSLCAKVLKLANSAIIGLREPVSSPFEAVMQLGVERIRAFFLSSRFVTQFDQQKVPWFSIERFWNHSILTANFARLIALSRTGDTRVADASFTAGLLHDVGILLIAANNPTVYKEIISTSISNNVPLHIAEKSIFSFTHSEIAACLLSAWSLPLAILEAIAAHHKPGEGFSSGFSPLAAVHIANAFANEKDQNSNLYGDTSLDNEYLLKINCDTQLEEFKKVCFESAL
ncbi:MAG: HDOD domain-containing protein [Verrucomicrobiia bacterium]